MSGDPGTRRPADAGHLDTDPEAMEDPVHRGDAEHQHELHQHELHQHRPTVEDDNGVEAPEDTDTDTDTDAGAGG